MFPITWVQCCKITSNPNNLNMKLSDGKVQNADIIGIKGTHDGFRQVDSLLWLNPYFILRQLHYGGLGDRDHIL